MYLVIEAVLHLGDVGTVVVHPSGQRRLFHRYVVGAFLFGAHETKTAAVTTVTNVPIILFMLAYLFISANIAIVVDFSRYPPICCRMPVRRVRIS